MQPGARIVIYYLLVLQLEPDKALSLQFSGKSWKPGNYDDRS